MCGICGQLTWGGADPVRKDLLERMNDSLVHRGPDDRGLFLKDWSSGDVGTNGSVGLAMRRLSIIDVAAGRQPIFNETNDIAVVYNGETYNFRELRSELEGAGHIF